MNSIIDLVLLTTRRKFKAIENENCSLQASARCNRNWHDCGEQQSIHCKCVLVVTEIVVSWTQYT